MREIKFRAWNKIQKQMNTQIWLSVSQFESEDKEHVLMRYTGLHDKNGKEIYEGDVVECYSKDGSTVYTYPHEVKLPDFYREIWSENEHGMLADFGQKTKVLVVGNRYENPELVAPTAS